MLPLNSFFCKKNLECTEKKRIYKNIVLHFSFTTKVVFFFQNYPFQAFLVSKTFILTHVKQMQGYTVYIIPGCWSFFTTHYFECWFFLAFFCFIWRVCAGTKRLYNASASPGGYSPCTDFFLSSEQNWSIFRAFFLWFYRFYIILFLNFWQSLYPS